MKMNEIMLQWTFLWLGKQYKTEVIVVSIRESSERSFASNVSENKVRYFSERINISNSVNNIVRLNACNKKRNHTHRQFLKFKPGFLTEPNHWTVTSLIESTEPKNRTLLRNSIRTLSTQTQSVLMFCSFSRILLPHFGKWSPKSSKISDYYRLKTLSFFHKTAPTLTEPLNRDFSWQKEPNLKPNPFLLRTPNRF